MEKLEKLILEARQVHDELELKLHLLNMNLKDQWLELSDKLKTFEKLVERNMVSSAEKLGKAEETFYAGSEEELAKLVEEFKKLRDSHNNH
tara:strand:- start:614 stop:886 length:273 start_codon:yes stop_codon:yes gene_type:complete